LFYLTFIFSTLLGGCFALAQEVPGEFILKMKEQKLTKGMQGKVQAKLFGKAQLKQSFTNQLHHFRSLKTEDTQALLKELRKDPEVEYVEPNYYIHRDQSEEGDQHLYSYDDVQQMSSAGSYIQSLANFGIPETWSILSSVDSRPIVAVVDTGVDISHPIFTLSDSVWSNPAEISSNGIDDDGNGFVDDIHGWNFYARSSNVMDDQGHGTHIAGIIQGVGQDLFSSALEQSYVRIMPLKFMDASGTGTTADAIAAVYYAANNGAKVINNSWGGNNYSQALHDALTYAYSRSVVIVCAAGNYARNNDISPLYPANLPIPSSLSVAATNDYDNLASFSSYGARTVDVGAPGVAIFSTYPSNSFRYLSGTSMAAPMVAGLAALIAREAPNLSGYQIKEKIMTSSDYVVNLRDRNKAQGRMDSYTSVVNAKADVSIQTYQPDYAATPPAGAVDYSQMKQGGAAGCGTVVSIASSAGSALGKLKIGLREVFVFGFLLLMPLLFWFVARMKWVSRPRRAHDRFVLKSEVKIKVGGRELVGNLNTIGVGGVSFDADAMIAKGGQVNLTITGPDGQEQIQVLGRVVWSEEAKSYGVQFAPMRETLVDRIRMWTGSLIKAA